MEPASAFALAGTILQFIDTGSRFFKVAYQLYRAEADAPEPLSELEKLTQSFNDVLKTFESSRNDTGRSDGQCGGLAKLAGECEEIGEELLRNIQEVVVSCHPGKRNALKRAFQMIFREGEINSLKSKLDNYRDQFSFHLLASLRLVHLSSI